ncbi:T9SS type A sorting domain-containing protein [Hymenobacter bucti]|uniref:T9SS type A sorting domain-containing protein n=1 Tax=Hymenobacter bucti TaxID=1844114 RepID=A0ABW4QYR8_9BACT
MKKHVLRIATLVAGTGLVFGTINASFAQGAKRDAKFKAATELRELIGSTAASRAAVAASAAKTTGPQKEDLRQIQGGYVVIDAASTDADGRPLLLQLQKLGLKNGAVYGRMVSGLFPIDQVGQLERVETLRFAAPAYQPMRNVGLTTSQGDASMLADKARTSYGVSGVGSKVGILSDSYGAIAGGPAAGVASGDLPAGVEVLEDAPGYTDEGRAMAEIVHDVAPGAKIAFHTAFTGQAGFASGIVKLADAGCNIVVDDVAYFAEPMFQDGVIAQAVDQVTARNVSYFSAAANQARQSYQAGFKDSGQDYIVGTNNYGRAHDFGNGDITQSYRIPAGGTLRLSFQWADPFFSVSGGAGARTDLDILVLVGGVVQQSLSGLSGNIGGDPVEIISLTARTAVTVELVIVKYEGPTPQLMKYINYGSSTAVPTEYATNSSTVTGHSNATSAIAIAAAAWYNTPVFNTNITRPVVEAFSSQGGTPVFITKEGVDTGYDDSKIRRKPVVTGPDGGNTTFFGSDTSLDPDTYPNFFGTSAAAPHVAAVAALMQEFAGTALTPTNIAEGLVYTAQDMDDPFTPGFDVGFDFRTGFGFVQADKAVLAVNGSLTTWTGRVSTNWFTEGNWSAGLPTATRDALIAVAPNQPRLGAGTAAVRNLILSTGTTLTQSGGTLSLTGNLTNNGTLVATGGTVATTGSTNQTLGGTSPLPFYDLSVGSAGATQATSVSLQDVLTLTGNLTTSGQPLTLLSRVSGGVALDALVVNSSGVVVGNATVQRAIDPSLNSGLGYRHYSSPVANTTVADLATTGFTPVVNPAYNTSPTPNDVVPFPTVFGYDQALVNRTNASPNFDKGFFSPSALSAPLVPGRGYNVNIGAAELVDFVGTLNNGDLGIAVARNAANTLNAADAGWLFLGNPYPAPLDYSLVKPADRTGLEDAIYVFSSTSQYGGQYRAYVNGVGGNPVIPIAQGFFARVAAPGTTGTFTFRNSQRLTSPNGTSFQRTAATPRPLVQLELGMANGPADTFYAYAEAGATPAFDAAFDAPKLPNPMGLNLASLVGSERLAIDGRAAFTAETTIPLALSVPAAGTYSLRAAAPATLPAGLTAYLYDRQLGQTVLLTENARYSFSVTAGQATTPIEGRFTLLFGPIAAKASLSAAEVNVYPNPAHKRFTVQVPAIAAATSVQAELLNTLGQSVSRQTAAQLATGTTLTVETEGLATGVYTLRLQAGSSTLTKRVVVQ